MNIACAYETERQNKKKMYGQQRPVSTQPSRATLLLKRMRNHPLNRTLKFPLLFSLSLKKLNLKWLCWKILKLKCLRLGSPCNILNTCPDSHCQQRGLMAQQACIPNLQIQGYWFTPGPRHRGVTTQYQKRFAPQRNFPPSHRSRMRKCFGCQQNGAQDYCTHGFRCGSSEHFLGGCRTKEQRQFGGESLNGGRMLARDREWPVTQQGPSNIVDKRVKG